MSKKLNVVTGATGLLGSHIAERLTQAGERVRALVRAESDTHFLESIGVELSRGDLQDVESLRTAFHSAEVVYHCAAKVGDWGPWRQFQSQVIDGAQNVLQACEAEQVKRVLHTSSVTVYGHPRERGELFTEDEPLGQNLWLWDYYCRAKIEVEKLCRDYPGDLTIIRPSWIFGERDRNTMPRLFKLVQAGRARLLGSGENKLNIVYAGDVARGAILAANSEKRIGQAYNLCSPGEITQRELMNLLTDEIGRKRIRRRFPFRVAYWAGFLSEIIGRIIRLKRPPHITRYGVGLIERSTQFSIQKARDELGWDLRMPIEEGLRRALDWYRSSLESRSMM